MKTFLNGLLLVALAVALNTWLEAQPSPESVKIDVHFDTPQGPFPPVWNYFGYDEPNYTYAPNGKKLLGEIGALSPTPPYIRVHNLMTSGDGSASLKWGSTNVYTEDPAGKPIYSWTILDRIFDTIHAAEAKPLVEIGFMPEALSVHPQPYRHNFPHGTIFTGWAFPPKDYQKWSELVFQFVRHLRNRYGDEEVRTWLWEVWNEPDIEYWKGTPDEYFKLYDFSVDAILRAFPAARVGGPDSTGPASPKAAEFLKMFLEHCAHGKNYASGATGSRLDFISFHPKGSPKWLGDHVQMGIARQLQSIREGFRIASSFAEWRKTPIILGESDPEGCAACSAKDNPQNSYRNGPLFACYTAAALNSILALIKQEHINFLGAVTWSFEFEDQPYFEGYRELATNGIDKPVFNGFQMFGLMGNERVSVTSSGALSVDEIASNGVRERPDVNAIATRGERELTIMIWNYHDDDLPAPEVHIDVTITGLLTLATNSLIEHFRVDSNHSNSFAAWKQMGSPQNPSPGQYQELQRAGQLQLLESPRWMAIVDRTIRLQFALPRQGLSLVRLSW